jgi:hypothetical protein
VDDLSHARALCGRLGDLFCLTYVKGVSSADALSLMSAPPQAVALSLGAWSVVVERGADRGSDHDVLEAVSRGTEAVVVLRDDARSPHFGYAVDGTTVTAFDPGYPAEETMWGTDTELLRPLMRALDIRTPDDENESPWEDAEAKAIVLAQRITGGRLPDDPLGSVTSRSRRSGR